MVRNRVVTSYESYLWSNRSHSAYSTRRLASGSFAGVHAAARLINEKQDKSIGNKRTLNHVSVVLFAGIYRSPDTLQREFEYSLSGFESVHHLDDAGGLLSDTG